MSLVGSFSEAAQGLFDKFDSTRRSLRTTALLFKLDAKASQSWGFYAIGSIAHRLLSREQDAIDAHRHDVRTVAERTVELTHFMTDPDLIQSTKLQILKDNGGTVSIDELDAMLTDHLDDLFVYDGVPRHRGLIAAMRHQRSLPASPIPGLDLN